MKYNIKSVGFAFFICYAYLIPATLIGLSDVTIDDPIVKMGLNIISVVILILMCLLFAAMLVRLVRTNHKLLSKCLWFLLFFFTFFFGASVYYFYSNVTKIGVRAQSLDS